MKVITSKWKGGRLLFHWFSGVFCWDTGRTNSPFYIIMSFWINWVFFHCPSAGPHHIKASRRWKLSNTIVFFKENFQHSQFQHSLFTESVMILLEHNPKEAINLWKAIIASNSQLYQQHTFGKGQITQYYKAGEESTEKCFPKEKVAKSYIGIYIMRIYIKYSL